MELDPIRADTSYQMRQKHYTDTVKQLVSALDDATIGVENDDDRSLGAGYIDEIKHSLGGDDWQHELKSKPRKIEREVDRAQRSMYFKQINYGRDSVVKEQSRRV